MLTTAQVADYLRVTEEYVRRLLRRGELPGVIFGRRGGWRVSERELEAWLRMRRRSPSTPAAE